MTHFSEDQPFDEAELEGTDGDAPIVRSHRGDENQLDDDSRRGAALRSTLAVSMWADYIS